MHHEYFAKLIGEGLDMPVSYYDAARAEDAIDAITRQYDRWVWKDLFK